MATVIENDRGNPNVLVATAHCKYSLLIYNPDLNQTKFFNSQTNVYQLCMKCLFRFNIHHMVDMNIIPLPNSTPSLLFLQIFNNTTKKLIGCWISESLY